MPTYRIDLAYDGTGFRGWARNAAVRTVQEVVEEAVARVAREAVATSVAGRTDAGVHATGQVVSFRTAGPLDPDRLARGVTSLLGPEVVAMRAAEVPDDFDARFSARWRRYRYSLDTGPAPDPLRRFTAWHVPWPLDPARMGAAAAGFVGEHDFASFCRAARGRSTVRRVLSASWYPSGEAALTFEVAATSFCHQLVRSMVSFCVDAGRGRVDPGSLPEVLAARDRNASRGAAPPHGLVLVEVGYGPPA